MLYEVITMAARPPSNVVGILLAAGSGSRFGGEKLLHPLADGVAIAAHAARNLLAALPSARITSYNVCYTKLLRITAEAGTVVIMEKICACPSFIWETESVYEPWFTLDILS